MKNPEGIHPTLTTHYQRRVKSYEEQVWRYLVIEVATQQIIPNGQTDNDQNAHDLCMAHPKPAYVKKVLTNEILYRNF